MQLSTNTQALSKQPCSTQLVLALKMPQQAAVAAAGYWLTTHTTTQPGSIASFYSGRMGGPCSQTQTEQLCTALVCHSRPLQGRNGHRGAHSMGYGELHKKGHSRLHSMGCRGTVRHMGYKWPRNKWYRGLHSMGHRGQGRVCSMGVVRMPWLLRTAGCSKRLSVP